MADYKRPRWIEFVAELPKTATGKIQRFKLRVE
jgi:acyl-coenzyme A synthetase/AMP-(fatty) acid ligase